MRPTPDASQDLSELARLLGLGLTGNLSARSASRAPFHPSHPVGLQPGYHSDVDGPSRPQPCPHPGLPD